MRPREKIRLLSLLRSRIERETDIKRHQHGAVILAPNGSVVAVGVNIRGKGYSSRFSLHAEEMAIIRAARKGGVPKRSLIFIARLKADGTWGLSAPCGKCEFVIKSAGILHTEYT